jgi:hypothetical protein
MMRLKNAREAIISGHVLVLLALGCAEILIKGPVTLSDNKFEVTLLKLAVGPDQYDTADRHWEPKNGNRLVWATVAVRNRRDAGQRFYFKRIMLVAGKREIMPFIVDLDSAVTMRADLEPVIAPDETISRRLIFIVKNVSELEKLTYGKKEINIPENASHQ